MRIGLVRHFKVKQAYPDSRWVTAETVNRWFVDYELADIEPRKTDLGAERWGVCYASDLPRAARTAAAIFEGQAEETSLLREIPLPALTARWRMPFVCWAAAARLKQQISREGRGEIGRARERIVELLDRLHEREHESVLIVSHGALMIELAKELRRRGFRGPRFGYAANGKLYVYERR